MYHCQPRLGQHIPVEVDGGTTRGLESEAEHSLAAPIVMYSGYSVKAVCGVAAQVGAGSVVMTDLPPACVAVGVPARIVKTNQPPPTDMDQCDFVLDYII